MRFRLATRAVIMAAIATTLSTGASMILSQARRRLWRGRVQVQEPSPFLCDIENELMKHQPMDGSRRKPQDRQLKLL